MLVRQNSASRKPSSTTSNPLRTPFAVLPFDPVDLSELMGILLDNAGKWTRTQVAVSPHCSGDGAFEIRIDDDGPGMTGDQIAAAFEVGTRFDPEKPGSGLALAIARDISEAMDVYLALKSGPGGTTAAIWFQLVRRMD